MGNQDSPDVDPLVLHGQSCNTWLEFLDDSDPVLTAMALEAKNTPAKIIKNRQYYSRQVASHSQ